MHTTVEQQPRATKTDNTAGRRIALIVGTLLVVTLIGLAIFRLFGDKPKTIKIGDMKITQEDIEKYSNAVSDYERNNNVNFEEDPTDDLILNAALKKEAKDRNISLTQEDIDGVRAPAYEAFGSKENYESFLEAQGITDVMRIRSENEAYKPKLAPHLLATKDIFLVSIPYDTPLTNSMEDHGFSLHDDAIGTLNTKFKPLFEQKKSRQEIASQADVDFNDADKSDDSDHVPYTQRLVTNATFVQNYTHGDPFFKDIEVEEFNSIPGLTSTDDKLKSLTEVGQYTDVFAAKAGFFAIARLEAKSNGMYGTWEEFLKAYKDKYTTSLTATILKPIKTAGGILMNGAKATVSAVDNLLTEEAEARHNYLGCSAHVVNFYLRSYDVATNGRIGGARVHFEHTSDCSPCGDCNGSSSTPTNYTTSATVDAIIRENCWSPQPSWSQTAPTNYDFVRVESEGSSGFYSGWPDWSSSTINSIGGITVRIYYRRENRPPTIYYQSPPNGTVYNYNPGDIITINSGGGGLNGQRSDPDESASNVSSFFRIGSGTFGPTAWRGTNNPDDREPLQFTTNASDSSWSYRWGTSGSWITGDGGSLNGRSFYWNCYAVDSQGLVGPNTCNDNNGNVSWRFSFSRIVINYPDYIPRNLNGPASVAPGQSVQFTGDIYNAGPAGAGQSSNARFCIDNPSCLSNTTGLLGNISINALASGASSGMIGVNWTPTSAQVGIHTVYLCADTITALAPTGAVRESNEGNNCISSTITVGVDTPPTIIMTPDCATRTVRVQVIDPDGGTSSVYWSVGIFPPTYANRTDSNDFTIPMSGANQYTTTMVYARTRGIAPGGGQGLVDVYQSSAYGPCLSPPMPFTLNTTPLRPTLNDPESPSLVNFDADVSVSGASSVNTNINRTFYIRRANGTITSLPTTPVVIGGSQTSRRISPTEVRSLAGLSAGDQLCQSIWADTGSGQADSSGNVVISYGPELPEEACVRVVNLPYLKVFQGSVAAGSTYRPADNCSSTENGEIRTHARYNGGQPLGSSAQYMAQARGLVLGDAGSLGFFSASPRLPSNGGYLTVANRGFNGSGNWGGNFGAGRCLIDYYNETQNLGGAETYALSASRILDINSATIESGHQYRISGNVILTASGPVSKRTTIYVSGEVMIGTDINYSTSYDPSNPDNVPYLTVVSCDNIYIDSSVRALSGLYIAQPRPGAHNDCDDAPGGGAIFTCATGGLSPRSMPAALVATACDGGGPLVVRGAFIAKKIHFHRSHGTLRGATVTENDPRNETNAAPFTNVAEKFYLTPELYLGRPVFRPLAGESETGIGEADSYQNLPPIF